MGWESSDVVRFDLEPLLQGQMRTAKLKSAITCLLLILEVCNMEPTYRKSWAGNLLMFVRFDLGLLLQGQTRIAKCKSAYNSLIIGPNGLLCQTNLWEIMGWDFFDVVRFDRGPLLQGQIRIENLKVLITRLLLVLEACNVKPTLGNHGLRIL